MTLSNGLLHFAQHDMVGPSSKENGGLISEEGERDEKKKKKKKTESLWND